MVNAFFYSNIATPTTLSGNINNSVTTCTVASTTGWPSSTPYIVALDYGTANEELVRVTANAAGTLTIVRAYGGTSAASHSTGAVVRHVYNAQDATDFRTHEQSTSGAHGIAGTFVGTTDSQTLTNKTLTAPTINNGTYSSGGSFSGTFAGTPTFSQAVVFSGNPNFSGTPTFAAATFSGTAGHTGLIQSQQSASGNTSFASIINADTFDRFRIYADGKHEWGSGALARDVNLYRSSADVLKTDDKILSERASAGQDGYAVKVVGDANDRLLVTTDSTGAVVKWGNGTLTPDTNLYRGAADTLKTDDSLIVVGTIASGTAGIEYRAGQSGSQTVNFSAVAQQDAAVSFPVAFSGTPNVLVSINNSPSGSGKIHIRATTVSSTGFTMRFATGDSTTATTTGLTGVWWAYMP